MSKIEDPADVGVFIKASMKVQRKKNTTFQNSLPHTYHVVPECIYNPNGVFGNVYLSAGQH